MAMGKSCGRGGVKGEREKAREREGPPGEVLISDRKTLPSAFSGT